MKQKILILCVGVLLGAALTSGGCAMAAMQLTAVPSTQSFYVDGAKVELEAYVINGNNYVKLRDIGRAVDFGVAYDGTTNSVQVDSTGPYVEEVPATPAPTPSPAVPEGVIKVPQSDERLILKEGDKVLCDDGTIYEIKDMSRYDKSMFASGPLPPLPTPTCDWSQFPELELPQVEVRHFVTEHGDRLFIRNLYETRRMQYTIYNCVPNCPELWEDGRLKLNSKGNPILRLQLGITETGGVQPFWPWKEEQLTRVFYSVPGARFAVEAWDVFKDGKYLYTEYNVQGR